MAQKTHRFRVWTLCSDSKHVLLWTIAVLAFGLGDILTTGLFLSNGMNFEGNPFAATLFDQFGLWIMLPWKTAVFAAFAMLYRLAPDKIQIGIPLGLALFGTVLTMWNIYSSLTGVRIIV